MSNDTREHDAQHNAIYMNLLAAYLALVQMRDYMRFLAKVTESRSEDNPELMVHPQELTWFFAGAATDLNDIAATVQWSANEVIDLTESRTSPRAAVTENGAATDSR